MPDSSFWNGKRVLLTGHTGFKGSWLSIWLHHLGAEVQGVALDPHGDPNLFHAAGVGNLINHRTCDIRDLAALQEIADAFQPEIVIHLAAQALVRKSYVEPLDTFSTNVMGTANVLETLRTLGTVKVAIIVTTDKVYADDGGHAPYTEDSPLGGHDPYSASKAASEIVIDSYRKSFLAEKGVAVASARAGNVIGGGDWSEDRLLPDAVRAWITEKTLDIRMPGAIRPWQHVLEPLAGYLALAELLWDNKDMAGPYNFGPPAESAVAVGTVVKLAREAFGTGDLAFSRTPPALHEAECLMLDTAKSANSLYLKRPWTVTRAVTETMSWYKAFYQGEDPCQLCRNAIEEYERTP